jgi:hypothetical protein
MNEERWMPVKEYEGIYEVSNKGRVKSLERKDKRGFLRKERIMRQVVNPRGYSFIVTQDKRSKVVHRLVAEAFIDNPDGKGEVNHLNGIKTDNRLENLEWATHSENLLHACREGLRNTPKGEKNHNAKLTNKESEKVRELYAGGDWTYKKLSEKYDVGISVIAGIVKGKTYKSQGVL